MKQKKKPLSGFSLLEVMLVSALIGILSTIAYPSYTSLLYKSRRLEAKTALLDLSQKMEHYFMREHAYTGAHFSNLNASAFSSEGFYQLRIARATNTEFQLEAIPMGSQAKDACGTFRLNHANVQTAAQTHCW